jgi:outer membrane protein W
MKTRKMNIAFLAAGIMLSAGAFGQGLYFGLGGGYGFAAAKADFNDESKAPNGVSTYTAKSYSFGKGVNIGLFGGYMFNKNVGAELGIGYLIGGSSVATYQDPNITVTSTLKGSMLRLIPAIRIQCGENKLHPYAKAGLIIGLAGKATSESLFVTSNSTQDQIWTYTGGSSFGFHGAIGITYMVSDKLGIFGELAGYYQQASPSKGEMTKNSDNGIDQLPKMNTQDKMITYQSSFSDDANSNKGNPLVKLTTHNPFSSFGFNIGIHFSLGSN